MITVFTPTYNRGYILGKLYKSLCAQTEHNFEWLIIDDGSSDNTEELVKQWIADISEHKFDIRYKKIENGGKPRAINYGIHYARGEFFFIVDSDDNLTPDAIKKLTLWTDEIRDDKKIVGVGAARGNREGQYLGKCKPIVNANGYVDAKNLDRKKYNLNFDMCEAYKTDIFKRYPMAVWEGEKFAPEQISINEMALDGYLVRWYKDIIYECEYLEDGLTRGSQKLEANNPMGYAMMYNHMLLYPDMSFKEKYIAASNHVALSIVGNEIHYIFKSNCMLITILALPIGFVISRRRKKQFKELCIDK